MKLSIIITSWNTKELLRACLQSIRLYPPSVPFETIVVDNASKDSSCEMVENNFPEVLLVQNNVNTGYARGNNLGFHKSKGDYVLLLGSDTEVLPGTIQRMVDVIESKPSVGIIACRLQLPDGRVQHSCKKFPTVANAMAMYCSLHYLNKKYLMSDFDHKTEKEIDQPDATCVMIRRSALRDRIFDERFSILYNDVDLCHRIKNQGWKILFIPDVSVIHHGSQSTKQASPKVRLVMYQNILLYYQQYFGMYARIMLSPILTLRYLAATRKLKGLSLMYSINTVTLS